MAYQQYGRSRGPPGGSLGPPGGTLGPPSAPPPGFGPRPTGALPPPTGPPPTGYGNGRTLGPPSHAPPTARYAGPKRYPPGAGPSHPMQAVAMTNTMLAQQTAAAGAPAKEEEKAKPKANRMIAGKKWYDPSLESWDEKDFRCFVGDLGNEVSDEGLARAFSKYSSIQKAKVIRDKRNQKSKGFGFVSFKDPNDFMKAMREMNGKYIGNRPIKMRKSSWKDRDFQVARKKEKAKATLLGPAGKDVVASRKRMKGMKFS